MRDGEPLHWYANSDDPYHTVRHSGGIVVAAFLFPALLVICIGCANGMAGPAMLLPLALVPFAVIGAVWEFVADRRAVVKLRLAGGELTLIRVNQSTKSVPISDVRRIEVVRGLRGGTPAWSRLLIHAGQKVERTRTGPADLPDGWAQTLTAAGVDLRIREKHYDD